MVEDPAREEPTGQVAEDVEVPLRALVLAGLVDTAVALAAAPVSAETARLARRPA